MNEPLPVWVTDKGTVRRRACLSETGTVTASDVGRGRSETDVLPAHHGAVRAGPTVSKLPAEPGYCVVGHVFRV